MNHAIRVQGLHKSFGENHAVQGVSFDVEEGEIFSLLGPKGTIKFAPDRENALPREALSYESRILKKEIRRRIS